MNIDLGLKLTEEEGLFSLDLLSAYPINPRQF